MPGSSLSRTGAATVATINIPSREYTAGERILSFPPSVLKRFTGAKIVLTRENWPVDQGIPLINIVWERSTDGSVWTEIVPTTFPGGNLVDSETGVPITISSAEFRFSSEGRLMLVAGVDTTILGGGAPPVQTGDLRVRITNQATINTALMLETIEP